MPGCWAWRTRSSKYRKGAKKFHRLATLHCAADGHRPTLGVGVVRREDDAAGTVRRLLWRARRRGIRMSSVTVDRGFRSVDVMGAIKAAGMPPVTPAVRPARIKGAVKECGAGERGAASAHTVTDSAGRSASYTPAILERGAREKRHAGMTPGTDGRQGCTTGMPRPGSTACSPPPWARTGSGEAPAA